MRYAVTALFFAVMCGCSLHYFAMLQLGNYKVVTSARNERFFLVNTVGLLVGAILFVLLTGVLGGAAHDAASAAALAALAAYYFILYAKKRSKLVFTARAKRMLAAYVLICLAVCAGVFTASRHIFTAAIWLSLVFCPFLCCAALAALKPFEARNNKRYVDAARQKLLREKELIRIGITGSYGKTSCKLFLRDMLSSVYNVCATKASYNTPLGIARSVNDINKATDIFIAEMGARTVGDISELADIVKPSFAVITGVTRQHMESFKTLENIFKEKQQLMKALPSGGFCAFNGENCYTKHMYYKCRCKKSIVGFCPTYDIYAENIETGREGSSFEIVWGENRLPCATKLLGRHNILNILLAFAVAKQFPISDEQLRLAIAGLRPVSHRLELIEANGISIIDDSYNCNIEGAVAAFEVLKAFGGRKVVFSQGIVETGKKSDINVYLGRLISKVADVVILCGANKDAITAGLKDAGFAGEIHLFKDLGEAQRNFRGILKKGDALLIQNDLPDCY